MKAPAVRRQRGFSLLELLVAFAIMALALGALYRASGGAVRTAVDTDRAARANLLARSLLNARDAVPATGWHESGVSGGLAWQVQSAPYAVPGLPAGAPRMHEVRLAIRWEGGRGPQVLELATLLPQARPPGEGAR